MNSTNSILLSWPFGEKTIVWLAKSNKYILAEEPAVRVIQQLEKGKDIRSIICFCAEEFNISPDEAELFVNDIKQILDDNLDSKAGWAKPVENKSLNQPKIQVPFSKRYYLIYGISFFVEYETAEIELLIHPKFEHMETPMMQQPDHVFRVYSSNGECSLWVDGIEEGSWTVSDIHYLVGKFSMQILQKIYQQEENDWMAVFHAAGISNGKNCLMFLGDSGNGKSTLSAILMANGLDVLADDFLPVESSTGLVCNFPAAISVKNKAYDLLIPTFPQLKQAREINNSAAGKTFRHLPPTNSKQLRVPCKALIFVKYQKDADFRLEEMSGEEAFKHLVPDSWISPTSKNANRFVNWFTSRPYYRMTYSNNEQMIKTIRKMLNDEL